jgi:preprotein translocase subunit SecB
MSETDAKTQDLQAAKSIATTIEFVNIHLAELSCKVEGNPSALKPEETEIAIAQEAAYLFDEPTKTLAVRFAIHVTGTAMVKKPKGKKAAVREPKNLVRIDPVFVLEYRLNGDVPPENERDLRFGAFARLNGTLNAWPFARETVASLFQRMGLPPFHLPVYRVCA